MSDARALWQHIITALNISPQDIQTVLRDGSGGLWIHAKAKDGTVEIDKARDTKPSSALTLPRYIAEDEFAELYPLYFKWRKKEITREQIVHRSQKSSYIFALIHKFGDIQF